MNIELHIDRLVLDGFTLTPRERAIVRAAVEGELTRLLTEGGIGANWQSGGVVPGIRADSMHLSSNQTPSLIGEQIAQSVYSGIGKTK